MNIQDIVGAVYDVDNVDDIDKIFAACKTRIKDLRKRDAAVNAATLQPGDFVKLHGLSPKYINGAIVIVNEVRGDKLACQTTEHVSFQAKNKLGTHFTVPASCVTKLADQEKLAAVR